MGAERQAEQARRAAMTGKRSGIERQLGKAAEGWIGEAVQVERQAGRELLLLLKGNGQRKWREALVRCLLA